MGENEIKNTLLFAPIYSNSSNKVKAQCRIRARILCAARIMNGEDLKLWSTKGAKIPNIIEISVPT